MQTATKTKEYIRPIPADWWLRKPAYTRFMVRDATSIFIGLYCVFLLWVMYRADHQSAYEFDMFYQSWGSPLSMVLHLIALAFALYHSFTFFNLTPQVLVVFRGEEKVPGRLIAAAHFAGWALVSVVLLVLALVI